MSIVLAPVEIFAGRGFGAGLGIGLLSGAVISSAAYNNAGYGYYPQQPYAYAYGPQYNPYGYSRYNPYW